MQKGALTSLELRDLRNHYVSERNKLLYQLNIVDGELERLEKKLEKVKDVVIEVSDYKEVPAKAKTGRKRGRPAKATTKTATKGRRGRPAGSKNKKTTAAADATKSATTTAATKTTPKPKASKAKAKAKGKAGRKPRALNEWDMVVMDALNDKKHMLINSDLRDQFDEYTKKNYPKMKEDEVASRLSRTLHKLVNTRKLVKKVKYDGKGNGYALNEWVNPAGSVKRNFKRPK